MMQQGYHSGPAHFAHLNFNASMRPSPRAFWNMPGLGPSHMQVAGARVCPTADNRSSPGAAGPSASTLRPPNASENVIETLNPSCMVQGEEERRAATRKRAAEALSYKRPYLREMKAAHAEQREPVIEIPVCPAGKVLGMKTPWHRAARLCARQTLNFKIRSYKARTEYWNSQIELIASKLSSKFIYSNPLSNAYLGKFLRTALKTDRKHWKKHFIDFGLQHAKCPDEAFKEWSKYWVSTVGKEESQQMTEMRSKVRASDSFCTAAASSDQAPSQVLVPSSICISSCPILKYMWTSCQ